MKREGYGNGIFLLEMAKSLAKNKTLKHNRYEVSKRIIKFFALKHFSGLVGQIPENIIMFHILLVSYTCSCSPLLRSNVIFLKIIKNVNDLPCNILLCLQTIRPVRTSPFKPISIFEIAA